MFRCIAWVSLTAAVLGCGSSHMERLAPVVRDAAGPAEPDSGSAPEMDAAVTPPDAAPPAMPVMPMTPPAVPKPPEPLPPPQPSAAGILEACAFEPASKAPEGAGSQCPGGVFRGDLRIDSEEDADGVAGCTRVEGNVEMIGGDAALAKFAQVRVVTGDLLIHAYTDNVCGGKGGGFACRGGVSTSILLAPLRSLRCVGGDFVIGSGVDMPISSDLSPLGSLVEVGGNFVPASGAQHLKPPFTSLQRVWGTIEIIDLTWLPVLDTVYGNITTHVPSDGTRISLVSKSAVPSVHYMGCGSDDPPCRDGVLGCSFSVSSDAGLERYRGCKTVIGDAKMRELTVTDLSILAGLRTVTGTLSLISTSVPDLNALAALDRATGVYLEYNSRLRDVSGLDGIAVRSIYVGDHAYLRDLDAWRTLRPLGEVDVTINLYRSLETIGEWPWLVRARSFEVTGAGLKSLGRFDNLTRVGVLGLRGVLDLVDANSFPRLESIERLAVIQAPALKVLPALPALSSKLMQLEITETGVTDLRGFEKLEHVDMFTIWGNPELTSLDGSSGLQTAGSLGVERNPKLRSLRGLSNLTSLETFHFSMNATLTDCEINWLAERAHSQADTQRYPENGGPPGPCAAP